MIKHRSQGTALRSFAVGLDCILSLNCYSVLYLQSQGLAIKVLSNVWEVGLVHVYPVTVWLTGTICKRSSLPVASIYLQLYQKCF